jgi:hypothetical protein
VSCSVSAAIAWVKCGAPSRVGLNQSTGRLAEIRCHLVKVRSEFVEQVPSGFTVEGLAVCFGTAHPRLQPLSRQYRPLGRCLGFAKCRVRRIGVTADIVGLSCEVACPFDYRAAWLSDCSARRRAATASRRPTGRCAEWLRGRPSDQ